MISTQVVSWPDSLAPQLHVGGEAYEEQAFLSDPQWSPALCLSSKMTIMLL